MKLNSFIADKNKISILEISLCFTLFFFLLIRGTFRTALLPMLLLSLPHVILYGCALFNKDIKRNTFNKLIFVSFCIFYIGIKLYRGMDSLNSEGDRDDALYLGVIGLLNGQYPYEGLLTFRGHAIFSGPASILLSLPFVKIFNNIQIVSTAAVLFLVIYLWRYAEKISRIPILSLSLTLLILTPFANFDFWESGEELLYGLPFLYLSIIIFFSEKIKKDFLKTILIGMFLGISLMVRMTYIFPAAVVLFFVTLNKGIKKFILAALSLIFTILLICLPFAAMNYKHFIRHFLLERWFEGDVSFISQNVLFFSSFIILMYFYTLKKMPVISQIHILITAGIFISYTAVGYISLPWHALYWAVPFLIAFPYIYTATSRAEKP